ncbi:MAG: DUF3962 domain-containing protein [Hormoscilla sp. GUM202]|nr:DUF3962 domain-containing protein [Hormoscilla sp. GUM202]
MPSYDQLRTLSFRLPEGKPLKPQTFQILKFPEKWKSELRNLQAEITRRPVDKTNVPISSLNKALRALVPDLIYITPNAAKSKVQPWLYSAMPIDIPALYLIFNAWVKTQFDGKASKKQIAALLKKLPKEDLQWEATTVNVGTWTTAANGTAELGGNNSFILLPHVLAAKLSQDNISLEFGSDLLRFRRAPLSIGSKGAELVSWPPLDYPDKRGSWYWSVVITFTLQTVPFQSFPVLHCDLSLRRWVSRPNSSIPGGEETSVYLLTKVPWLKGLHNSNSFQVAPIGWTRLSGSEQQQDKSQYRLNWGSNLVPLLDRLNLQQPFPTPEAIVADPTSALNLNASPNEAVVFRNGIKPEHRVDAGFSPADRRLLAEQIAELIAPEWEFVEAPQRVKFHVDSIPKLELPGLPKDGEELEEAKMETLKETQSDIRGAISEAVSDRRLTIEIWYQRETTRDTLIKSVSHCLGIPASASFPYKFPDLEFTLNIQAQPLGALGDELQLNSDLKNKKDIRRQAIIQRGKEIAEKVPNASSVTVALIEIAGKENFKSDRDPYNALRRGFAIAGRNTQFISTDNPNLSHSSITGFLDLLRQLGVQVGPPKIVLKKDRKKNTLALKLPEGLNYVGLWLIKQNAPTSADGTTQRVPVMVYMASNTTEIKAIAPGFDNWLPYREALLKIAREGVDGKGQAMSFIEQKLKGDVLPLGDTLLLCHAQNLRSTWSWLNNGQIATETVAFGNNGSSLEINRLKGLRILRLRDSQSHETPEWYAQNPDQEKQGFAEGVFQMGDRVFASTGKKPVQFSNLSVNQSKAGDKKSPNTYYPNPGLVEITVACLQTGDEVFPWAALTHELRHIALQYNEYLKLPLPLHLAKQIEEYVLLMENEEIEDE